MSADQAAGQFHYKNALFSADYLDAASGAGKAAGGKDAGGKDAGGKGKSGGEGGSGKYLHIYQDFN